MQGQCQPCFPAGQLCPCLGGGKQQRTHRETLHPEDERRWRCVGHSPSSSSALHPPCPGCVRVGGSHNSSHSLESQPGVGVCGTWPCRASGSLKLLERRPGRGGRGGQKELRLFPSREGWILGDVALLCVQLKLLLGDPGGCQRFSLDGTPSEPEQRPFRSS